MNKISGLIKNNFIKSVVMITGGTVFAQAINMLLSPIITRIYSPEEFGVMTVYAAVLGMISLIGALSYDAAIPIASDEKVALNVLRLCLILLVMTTITLSAVLYIFDDSLFKLMNAQILMKYKYLVVIGFSATGIYTIFMKWALRMKDYKAIAVTKYSQCLAGNITKITFGILGFGPIGLILGRILAQSAGISTLILPLYKKRINVLKDVNRDEIIIVAKRYRNFPLFTAPTLFLNSFSSQLPVLLLAFYFGKEVVGSFGLAFSMSFLPMTIVGKSIQDVFYGEAASLGKKKPSEVKDLSGKLLKKMMVLGAIPMIALVLAGPLLFGVVFGEEWVDSGKYARILSLYVYCHFIFHPISTVFSIFEKQKAFFIINIMKLMLVLIVFLLVKQFHFSSFVTVLLFSCSMGLIEFIKYVMAQKIMSSEIRLKSNES